MRRLVRPADEMHVVSADDADAKLLGDCDKLRIHLFLFADALGLHLDEEPVLAEDVQVLAGDLFGGSGLVGQQGSGNLSAKAGGDVATKTDASGNYALMTFQAGDGAVPGDYNVGITKYERAATTGSSSEEDYVPVERGQSPAPAKNLLPAKYANPAKSGLTAKVIEGSNTFDFQLTD